MAKVVKVTSADVQRARLLVRVNESLDRPIPAGIRKIADAKPWSPVPAAASSDD
jgi:hypothetical protein